MNKHIVKSYIRSLLLYVPKFIYSSIYLKPKFVCKLLLNPSKVLGDTYFPEFKRKGRIRILCEQIFNIIRYGSTDDYYYMYGLDVIRDVKNADYVIYSDFAKERDKHNLSNPHNDSALLRNKLFFESLAQTIGIPTPKNIAYSENGNLVLLHTDGAFTSDWSCLNNQSLKNVVLYGKPIDGECGTGILKIQITTDGLIVNGEKKSYSDLQKQCIRGRYIFQQQLMQHAEMQRIYPGSVNTIRMITVRNPNNGKIEILPPTLRIGAHGSFVDNFSKGGVIVAMDTESGNLSEWGFFKPMYGFKSKVHPDTKIEFSSFHVPYYEEAKRLAIYFHSFLNLHSIGWDIAISDKGPVFIEGNDNWEINLPQTFDNPFRKEFDRLF